MTFKVCNLGSKQPYFNSSYVVKVPIFSFRSVIMFGNMAKNQSINLVKCFGVVGRLMSDLPRVKLTCGRDLTGVVGVLLQLTLVKSG